MPGSPFPLLLGHTARAGRWNHLTLVPPGLPAGVDIAGYLSAPAVGGNSVAVEAAVEQPATGRAGREGLAVVGVRVPAGPELGALEGWLRGRLGDLGRVVAGFDWAAHPGGPAALPELAAWRDEAVARFGLRPHRRQTLAPLPARNSGSRVPLAAVVAAAVVGFGLLSVGVMRRAGTGPFAPPPPPGPTEAR